MKKNVLNAKGFTLIELIIVITLTGIVAVFISTITGNQMSAYVDVSARANLVNLAESSLRRIGRDLHNAVPNSVRVSGNAIEFVPIVSAGRYRSAPSALASSNYLDFSSLDNSFQLMGNLTQPAAGSRLVIYNFSWVDGSGPVAGANLYGSASTGALSPAGSHVISPAGNEITVTNNGVNDLITLGSAFQFAFNSPSKRVYVVNGAASYVCDAGAGEIRRYSGYGIQSTQPSNGAAAPLSSASSSALLVDHVEACTLSYSPGATQRKGIVTIILTLLDNGERVRLVHQIHVGNRA
jgi:MSHA biogenesis protein MshO